MNRYEALCIVDNDLGDTGVEQVLQRAHREITDAGGPLGGVDRLGKRTLTHPIQARSHGFYAVVDFESPGEAIEGLMARYRLTEGLLRAHIVRARPEKARPEGEDKDDGVAE